MLITVSGPPGSGKSTNAAGLADRLGLDHVSGGDIFREMAAERDMTPVEFNEFAEEDPRSTEIWTVDSTRIATTRDDLVLESRLAGWLSADHADFRFWFDAPVSTRAERIAEREKPVDRAKAETERREASGEKTVPRVLRHRHRRPLDLRRRVQHRPMGTGAVHRRPRRDHRTRTTRDRRGKAPIEGVSYDF